MGCRELLSPNAALNLLHAGMESDPDLDSYHAGFRDYAPEIGRWLERDPIFHRNLYPYVGDRPTRRIDPTGRQAVLPFKGPPVFIPPTVKPGPQPGVKPAPPGSPPAGPGADDGDDGGFDCKPDPSRPSGQIVTPPRQCLPSGNGTWQPPPVKVCNWICFGDDGSIWTDVTWVTPSQDCSEGNPAE